MKSDSMAKFITAVKNAGINVWSAVTAPMIHWYHNPDQNQLILLLLDLTDRMKVLVRSL